MFLLLFCLFSFSLYVVFFFFFFQAEDGIRDHCVTGVQTCALPIFKTMVSGGGTVFCSMVVEALRCNPTVSGASKEQGSTGCEVPSHARLESDPVDEQAIIARCLAGEGREIGRASCRERGWQSGVGT